MRSKILRKIYARVASLPAQAALNTINLDIIGSRLERSYSQSCKDYKASEPLDEIETAIVAGLESDGHYITSLDALRIPGTNGMQSAAADVKKNLTRQKLENNGSTRSSYAAAPDLILANPDLFRWGLDPRLLRIVSAYLRTDVAYDGLHALYTVADGRETGTRNWHRDREDRRMVKVAVYHNVVAEGGGPLQMIRPNLSDLIAPQYTYPIYPNEGVEERLGRALSDADTVTCYGQEGTVIFSDTARLFHRGKPATEHDRFAVYYHYFSRSPRHPFFCARSGLSQNDLSWLAKDMSKAQRDAVLWRQSLPLAARIIPTSMI